MVSSGLLISNQMSGNFESYYQFVFKVLVKCQAQMYNHFRLTLRFRISALEELAAASGLGQKPYIVI